jgi:hypothetical protein
VGELVSLQPGGYRLVRAAQTRARDVEKSASTGQWLLLVFGIIRADVILGLVDTVRLTAMLGTDNRPAFLTALALHLITRHDALA